VSIANVTLAFVAETKVTYEETEVGSVPARGLAARRWAAVDNVLFIEWTSIALAVPVVIDRAAADHPRGRPYKFDQEMLDTLRELPQPPRDDY